MNEEYSTIQMGGSHQITSRVPLILSIMFRMYDYVTKELPELVAGLFPVDPVKMSVTGTKNGVRTYHREQNHRYGHFIEK